MYTNTNLIFVVFIFLLFSILGANEESKIVRSPDWSIHFYKENHKVDIQNLKEVEFLHNLKNENVETINFTWSHFIYKPNDYWYTWLNTDTFSKLKNFNAQWIFDSKGSRNQKEEYGVELLKILEQLGLFDALEIVNIKLDRMDNIFTEENKGSIINAILALDVREFNLEFVLSRANFDEETYNYLQSKQEEFSLLSNMKINFDFHVF